MAIRQVKSDLYQVNVETRDGKLIAIGPKMVKDAAINFATSIQAQVTLGKEKEWGNPHLIRVNTI